MITVLIFAVVYGCKKDDDGNSTTNSGNGTSDFTGHNTVWVVEDCNGWDDVRVTEEGSTFFYKYSGKDSLLYASMFLLREDSVGTLSGYVRFNDDGYPVYLLCNGVSLIVNKYYDEYADVSIISNDSIVFTLDSLQLGDVVNGLSKRKNSVNQIALCQKLFVNAGTAALAVLGIASGVGTILATSAVAVAASPAIALGVAASAAISVGLNAYSLANSFKTAVELHNIVTGVEGATVSQSSLADWGVSRFGDATGFVPDHLIVIPADKRAAIKNLPTGYTWLNVISLALSVSFSTIDLMSDQVIADASDLSSAYRNCMILTTKPTNVTENGARLNGYVNGASVLGFQTKYGFILKSFDDKTIETAPIENGLGENFSIDCNDLQKATRYKYMSYLWDYTNGYLKFGATRSFRTEGVPVDIIKTSLNYSDENNGEYLYSINMNLNLNNDDDVMDWGFYYMENEQHKSYSLKGKLKGEHNYNFTYKSTKDEIMLAMGTYVKYKSEGNTARYGNDASYTFTHNFNWCSDEHHPHMVDLGLPSGTLWSCCNIGASTPTDCGGLYCFGEPTGTMSTTNSWGWQPWPEVISGTNYDIARTQWGIDWQLPVSDQAYELYNMCTWEWTSKNDVQGYKVIGLNGNFIFLPASGNRWSSSNGDIVNGKNEDCSFWLGNVIITTEDDKTEYYGCFLNKSKPEAEQNWIQGICGWAGTGVGLSIRPIKTYDNTNATSKKNVINYCNSDDKLQNANDITSKKKELYSRITN